MKKHTRIILIACAAVVCIAAVCALSPTLMKLRCRIFLNNMNNKTAVHTVSQTQKQEYIPDSGFVVTDTSTTQEWAYEHWVYYTSTGSSGKKSELLKRGHFFNNENTGFKWSGCGVSNHSLRPFWKFYTWEYLSLFPSSVRISNGLIQVVFLEARIGTDSRQDYERILQFNFLLQFDSLLDVTTAYSGTDATPDSIVWQSTTRTQIVHFDESENLSVIEEQYALAKNTD